MDNKYQSSGKFSLSAYQCELKTLLARIVTVLDREGIPYLALFGTCLGAVRHGDLIPWDDDIDIAVRREYYARARDCIARECRELFFWDWYADPSCCLSFGRIFRRIRPSDTLERKRAYVDLYVIDRVPDGKFLRMLHKLAYTVVGRHLIRRCGAKIEYKPYTVTSCCIFWLGLPLYLFPTRFLRNVHAGIMGMFSHPGCVKNFAVIGGDLTLDSLLNQSRDAYISDIKVKIPEEAERFLELQYGDWRSIPPEGQRGEHAYKADGEVVAALPDDSLRMSGEA